MPTLESFVRVSYTPQGPAAGAIRLLNEDLRRHGVEPQEARRRVQNFLKGQAHAHDSMSSTPTFVDNGRGMRLRRPTRGQAKA